jgi:hypothetical protein
VSRAIETSCTIDIEQTHDHFHAHVALDGDLEIGPGDRVQVHGTPIRVSFGDAVIERRKATVLRANWLERAWTKLAARFALGELYEVSFTPRRTL